MELHPVAGVRRHERPPTAVLLNAQVAQLRARERGHELVLVQREPEVIDSRQLPLAWLHDDVDCSAFELRQPKLEAHAVEVLPPVAGLERRQLFADAAVPRDELEAQLPDVPRLDL